MALNVSLVGLWAQRGDVNIISTRASTVDASLTFASSIGVVVLSWLEHERSYRPSFLLSLWLYLSALLDLPRTRTLWLLNGDKTIPAIFTTTLALRLALGLLESVSKRRLALTSQEECSPEVFRGLVSTANFAWLIPLLRTGYRKVFAVGDLYPADDWLKSKPLHEKLQEEWDKGMLSPYYAQSQDRIAPADISWLQQCLTKLPPTHS